MENTEYRAEIIRKHRKGGQVYEVSVIDLTGMHPIDRRRFLWGAFATSELKQTVANTRLDLLSGGWS